ncbi:hypothetical protein Patl1_15717 [Pistacia atlantica]|uniref:Uncharacterized protein n=1 Tax=Pistacia atlantica TaxID=434234 RepID=A0ACC1BB89_9ROSI|nr:hypothetical protein Patl1_15717 [Pistacia atlantica]
MEVGGFAAIVMLEGESLVAIQSLIVDIRKQNKCRDNKLAKKASPTRRLSGTAKPFHTGNSEKMAWRHRLMAFWVALVKGNESFLQTPFFERKKCSHLLEDHQGDRQPQLLVLLQFLVLIRSGDIDAAFCKLRNWYPRIVQAKVPCDFPSAQVRKKF